jgi:hypothetical protein
MWTSRAPGEASQALAPRDSFAGQGIHLTRANMDRVNGWRNLKDLMYSKRIKFFKGRTDRVASSLASVQRDPHDAGDVINHVYKPRPVKQTDSRPNAGAQVIDLLESMGKQKSRYS